MLATWIEKFGGDPSIDPFATERGKQGFEFKMDMAYLARIKKATLVRSQRGDEQIRLLLGILGNDDNDAPEVGQSMEHVTLPFQESDKSLTDRTKLERILQMRVDTLRKIFSAAIPSQYAPYDRTEADPVTNKKRYLDFDGQALTNGRYEERQQAVNERLMETLDTLKQRLTNEGGEVEELSDAYLYVHKKENPRNAKYPYTNYYTLRPVKIPVFSGDEETPF